MKRTYNEMRDRKKSRLELSRVQVIRRLYLFLDTSCALGISTLKRQLHDSWQCKKSPLHCYKEKQQYQFIHLFDLIKLSLIHVYTYLRNSYVFAVYPRNTFIYLFDIICTYLLYLLISLSIYVFINQQNLYIVQISQLFTT